MSSTISLCVSDSMKKILQPRKKEAKECEPWPKYYERRVRLFGGPDGYREEKIRSRGYVLEAVEDFTPKGGKVLEAGCGSSMLSIILNQRGFDTTCLDMDSSMLEVATSLNATFNTGVRYVRGDIFQPPFSERKFDVVFSHGVVEHFSEEEVIKLTNEALRVARVCVFSFPTICNRSNTLHGDENLWTYLKWKRTIEQSKGKVVRSYSAFSRRPIREYINVKLGRHLSLISPNVALVITEE